MFFSSPYTFTDEISTKLSIDLGVPVISMKTMLTNVAQLAGQTEEFKHPFYMLVKEMMEEEDYEALIKDRIPIKLLSLTAQASDGFVMTDFPQNVSEAEILEEF